MMLISRFIFVCIFLNITNASIIKDLKRKEEPDLLSLLKNISNSGITEIIKNKDNGIFLLGPTGSGKSVFASVLVDDNLSFNPARVIRNKKKKVVQTISANFSNSRIGNGFDSYTWIPEFISYNDFVNSQQIESYLIDCPGFKDTKGIVYDIGANYFIRKAISATKNGKLLFIIPYDMINNRILQFQMFLEDIFTLVPDLIDMKSSVGFIVSKCSKQSEYTESESLEFCRQSLVEAMQNILEKSNDILSVGNIEKYYKIKEFLGYMNTTIWSDDYNSQIDAMTLITSNEQLHGEEFNENKRNIKQFIADLSYVTVNSSKFKMDISTNNREQVYRLQEQIIANISKTHLSEICDEMTRDLNTKLAEFVDITNYKHMQSKYNNFISQQTKSSSLLEFGEFFRGTLEYLKEIDANVDKYINDFALYELLRDISKRNYPSGESAKKFKRCLNEKLENFKEWNELVNRVENELQQFTIPTDKLKFIAEYGGWSNCTEGECSLYYPPSIVLHESQRNLLRNLYLEACNYETEFLADNKELNIIGRSINISQVMRLEKYNLADFIRIHALDRVYFDADINRPGLKLSVISPSWYIIGERYVNLTGSSAEDIVAIGEYDSTERKGLSGHNGGVFYGLYKDLASGNLNVEANGGNGGRGQTGAAGNDGYVAKSFEPCGSSIYDPTDKFTVSVTEMTGRRGKVRIETEKKGTSSTCGKAGGFGGNPGYAGRIEILGNQDLNFLRKLPKNGLKGNAGSHGKDGKPGKHGNTVFLEFVGNEYAAIDNNVCKCFNDRKGHCREYQVQNLDSFYIKTFPCQPYDDSKLILNGGKGRWFSEYCSNFNILHLDTVEGETLSCEQELEEGLEYSDEIYYDLEDVNYNVAPTFPNYWEEVTQFKANILKFITTHKRSHYAILRDNEFLDYIKDLTIDRSTNPAYTLYSLSDVANDYLEIEKLYPCLMQTNNNIQLMNSLSRLLAILEMRMNGDQNMEETEHKEALFLRTAILNRLLPLSTDTLMGGVITDLVAYGENLCNDLDNFVKDQNSFSYIKQIRTVREEYKKGLTNEMNSTTNLLENFIIPEFKNIFESLTEDTNKFADELLEEVEQMENSIEEMQEQQRKLEQQVVLSRFMKIASSIVPCLMEVIPGGKVIAGTLKQLGISFDEVPIKKRVKQVLDTVKSSKKSNAKIQKLENLIEERTHEQDKLMEIVDRIYTDIQPNLHSDQETLETNLFQITKNLSNSELLKINYKIQIWLRDISQHFDEFLKNTKYHDSVSNVLLALGDIVKVSIKSREISLHLKDKIDESDYIENIMEAQYGLELFGMESSVYGRIKNAIQRNSIFDSFNLFVHSSILHSFPCWSDNNFDSTFSCGAIHDNNGSLFNEILAQTRLLTSNLIKKESTIGNQQNIQTSLESQDICEWDFSDSRFKINRLFSGQSIIVNCQRNKNDTNADAIKMKSPNIDFAVKGERDLTDALSNTLLSDFKFKLTKIGRGYYHCGDFQYKFPIDDSLSIERSFSNPPKFTNPAFDKLNTEDNSNFFLSPYGYWQLELYNNQGDSNDFSSLKKYWNRNIEIKLKARTQFLEKRFKSSSDICYKSFHLYKNYLSY